MEFYNYIILYNLNHIKSYEKIIILEIIIIINKYSGFCC